MRSRGAEAEARRNEAFRRVFDENWAPVRHHIEWIVDDQAEVSELVSEVFLRAWTRLDPDRPMGRVWLLRVADSRLKGRARRPHPRVLRSVHEAMRDDADATAEPAEEALLAEFSALSGRERRIIMLTYWDGLAAGEIAELLRSSRPRVERTLHRAQERLRTKLDTEGVRHD